ncbi:hypothetical protein DFP72DRAFT_1178442 [Ephemerocybe angulata]|uniref:Uncharacterized protein n=1 Tax=Ephemerocybe angulata TaxID=980116 RepID=A0A8H6H9Z3_9AGAR|nr:hypothetical protein DFP72DRAFT_1178442 [Tulosesus angulatus]
MDGEIVDRNFLSTYDVVDRGFEELEARKCTSVMACGTAGGCMAMAAQRYCTDVPWQKSFKAAIKQTGAIAKKTFEMVGKSLRGTPIAGVANLAKNAAKEVIKSIKNKKKKRSLDFDEEDIMNRRDFEIVERDEDMSLVERAQYSTFNLATRGKNGEIISRECSMYNGDVSCL